MPSEHVLETLEHYLSFFLNESSISRTAHPPLKISLIFEIKAIKYMNLMWNFKTMNKNIVDDMMTYFESSRLIFLN